MRSMHPLRGNCGSHGSGGPRGCGGPRGLADFLWLPRGLPIDAPKQDMSFFAFTPTVGYRKPYNLW